MFQDYSQEFELKIYILKNVSVSVFKELSLMEGTQTRLKIEYMEYFSGQWRKSSRTMLPRVNHLSLITPTIEKITILAKF